ncbi:hypothetical protein HDU87_000703 [Geranomyces variabilis]|uniref:Uncharacterized protein n=1 Tax=Geranomyces variabilis TaxID=109894 RepID=A0AAD5XSX7_9FUNG|nr:hypothetical protein HDU87_000703 [Geranomyces variabilis]
MEERLERGQQDQTGQTVVAADKALDDFHVRNLALAKGVLIDDLCVGTGTHMRDHYDCDIRIKVSDPFGTQGFENMNAGRAHQFLRNTNAVLPIMDAVTKDMRNVWPGLKVDHPVVIDIHMDASVQH